MKSSRSSVGFVVTMLLGILLVGCAAPSLYTPPHYAAGQEQFGRIALATTNKVYVCAFMDHLSPRNRALLDPKFTTWTYVTEALETELTASGISAARAPFEFGPSFASVQQTILEKADKNESAVYIAGDVLWLNQEKLTVDAKVYSPSGEVRFEKRGLCYTLNSPSVGAQTIFHMALRQIIADPGFEKALQ